MNNKESIAHLSAQIYRHSQMYMLKKLQKYNLGIGQLHFLKKLYVNDGINQEQLAKSLNYSKATSTRAIQKLEEEGYITRKRDVNDKRAYNVFLTDKGKILEPEINKIISEWNAILLTGFENNEKKKYISFLKKTINNASSNKHNKGVEYDKWR